ncbi:protein-N(pi)-phosphohistidine--sugar phosphotransferase [Bacillus sp. AFS076308]|uniref:PTS sugar transporter subunit IIC n=1 Tax=unclassified Bacillus (in: firmicutes) TaxID=185979 RepID=UPI000BF5F7B3|nr:MULTISPECIES: PTS transporter subunit EIIC [unclassified Bacillus (in: firmicutes)]PFN98699.1 protein-N(pi)-phosphohistidine--sugar phosphotransferase [Bacillus sp. AFS076308]PGV53521.1 protein-N(pi)-phosphohistidine--sugar phosphotransferase [Bacillus sp. AFS037270]
MEKLINWLEKDFAPRMNKINHNVWVITLKDSIMQLLPFILLGSLFCLLTIPGDVFHIKNYPNFWTLFGWTMGLLSLFVSFLIPFNLMEKKRMRKQRMIAGCTGLITFLIIISPQVIADKTIGFSHASLGSGGMFVAIVAGVFTGWIMGLFGSFSFFKEESVIPDFVRAWFDAMLPIAVVIVAAWLVVDIAGFDLYNTILKIFMPLAKVMESPWGFPLIMFITCFLYTMGISTWVLTPVTKPVLLAAITANATAGASNLVTSETMYSAYLWVGGIGTTLPLVIMLAFSKNAKLKALGRASITPSIFNINEPVVFGAIAWNPIMMFPMWIIGIVLPIIIWVFTKVIHFAPIPKIVFDLWYVPFPISTWITTGTISGLILMFVCVLVASVIWYPFFKVYEKQEMKNDVKEVKTELRKAK